MFGVETFLLPDGSVLLNEVAPRPHNSGHYTIEACPCSQFEAHLRAVLGWPLGDTGLRVGAAIMLNILGEAGGEEGERAAHELMGRAYATPGASVHWYGKAGVAAQRKIGHITIVGADSAQCRQRLRAIDPAAADAMEASTARVASELQLGGGAGAGAGGPRVGIIMGSDSDLATMKAAAEVLEEFGVPCEVTVVSAHRWVRGTNGLALKGRHHAQALAAVPCPRHAHPLPHPTHRAGPLSACLNTRGRRTAAASGASSRARAARRPCQAWSPP